MFCSNCGKPIEESVNFCPSCGAKNVGKSQEQAPVTPAVQAVVQTVQKAPEPEPIKPRSLGGGLLFFAIWNVVTCPIGIVALLIGARSTGNVAVDIGLGIVLAVGIYTAILFFQKHPDAISFARSFNHTVGAATVFSIIASVITKQVEPQIGIIVVIIYVTVWFAWFKYLQDSDRAKDWKR